MKKSSVKITRLRRSLLSRFIIRAIHFYFEGEARLLTIFLPFVRLRGPVDVNTKTLSIYVRIINMSGIINYSVTSGCPRLRLYLFIF